MSNIFETNIKESYFANGRCGTVRFLLYTAYDFSEQQNQRGGKLKK